MPISQDLDFTTIIKGNVNYVLNKDTQRIFFSLHESTPNVRMIKNQRSGQMLQAYFFGPPTTHVSSAYSSQCPWLPNSGASHHVKNDIHNRSAHSEYDWTDEIVASNSNSLPITHIRSTHMPDVDNKSLIYFI